MQLSSENILLIGSLLLLVSIMAGKTSSRIGVPTLVFFILIGFLAGSEGIGKIQFNDPQLAQFVGILALNFILFSGGLSTRWQSIKPILGRGLMLSSLGVLLTCLSLGVFAHWVIPGFTLLEGLLLGAIVSSTDAAAVFSILRSKSVGLKDNLRPTLELESGSNDPMAYFLTIAFISLLTQPESSLFSLVPFFLQQVIVGALMAYLMGKAAIFVMNRVKLDYEGLYPVLLISLAIFTFAATDALGGNGFLAVYLLGVIVGNRDFIHKKSLLRFYDGMAWLMQIVLFLTLGLLAYPSHILEVVGLGLLTSAFLILVARPIGVFLSLMFFKVPWRNQLFISWVGLRGAVPIVFATYPMVAGLEKAELIFNIVFFISLSSVLVQGTSLSIVAKWIGVAVPESEKPLSALEEELDEGTKTELTKLQLPINSAMAGKKIVDLGLPKSALIVLVERNDAFITPNGSTELQPLDNLHLLADQPETLDEAIRMLTRRGAA